MKQMQCHCSPKCNREWYEKKSESLTEPDYDKPHKPT